MYWGFRARVTPKEQKNTQGSGLGNTFGTQRATAKRGIAICTEPLLKSALRLPLLLAAEKTWAHSIQKIFSKLVHSSEIQGVIRLRIDLAEFAWIA